MPIPTPPTDNLYKFMAITGLLMVLGGLYLPIAWQERVNESARVFYDRVSVRLDQLDKATTDQAKQVLTDSITIERKILDATVSDRRFMFWAGVVSMAIGVVVASRGFVLWSDRFQKYQDMKVKREVGIGSGKE